MFCSAAVDEYTARKKALAILAKLVEIKKEALRKNILRKIDWDILEELVFCYADGKYVGNYSYIYLERKACEKFVLVCLRKFGLCRSTAIARVFYSFKAFKSVPFSPDIIYLLRTTPLSKSKKRKKVFVD